MLVTGCLAEALLKFVQVCSIKLNPLVLDALAGAAGEIAQVAALYPMDTIKVRLLTPLSLCIAMQ